MREIMVLTLTINPCMDKTVTLDHLQLEQTNHITGVRDDISGKGINVALGIHHMG